MGQILIRNLDDGVLGALKARARRHGASMEEEARQALTASVGAEDWLARLDQARAMNGAQAGPTGAELLRQDRDRDETP